MPLNKETNQSIILSDSEVTFIIEEEDAAFRSILYLRIIHTQHCIIKEACHQISFHTSGGISSSPASLLLLILFITVSSSSSVSCPIFNPSWSWIVSLFGLSVILGGFPSTFSKRSFNFWGLSSWLAAFTFDIDMFFLLIISFIVCYADGDFLS